MRSVVFIRLLLLACFSGVAFGQVPVAPEEAAAINSLFNQRSSGDSFHCWVRGYAPFLNFTFRHEAGFVVATDGDQVSPGGKLRLYLRIGSEGTSPVLLKDSVEVPPIPPEMVKNVGKKTLQHVEFDVSGTFLVGQGRYKADFVLLDERARSCRGHWKLQTHRTKAPSGFLPLRPNEVAPNQPADWDGKLKAEGLRLTVLLHAAPINPSVAKLHAWDRDFLLQTLSTLLKEFPCRSVRMVAFNLDQEQEIFRQERFDREGFDQLADALQKMELATVSYKSLRRHSGLKFLTEFAEREISGKQSSEAVVFLGPNSRLWERIPKGSVRSLDSGTRLFYFEYFPWGEGDFSDTIDLMTRDLNGTVFKIHSADQLGQAIQKMLSQVQPLKPNTSGNAGPSD